MRSAIAVLLLALLGLGGCDGKSATGGKAIGDRTLRFTVETLADCEAINDYPYARNLFCPAAFSAAQTMQSALAEHGHLRGPARGFFYYYQTRADPDAPADDQSQTTVGCQDIRAPWAGAVVVGAGTPLCHLIAYATSPGPAGGVGRRRDNPVPETLRAFPQYFSRLYAAGASSSEFGRDSAFDPLVRELGAGARDAFLRDYPSFSADELYDPADWQRDPQYHGISGGGGGGWGGEVSIERPGAAPLVLLAFGGGGGAGMTSTPGRHGVVSTVGAGGGGGMQLADGYRHEGRVFDGLGLGAGIGSDEAQVEYSYFDGAGSGRPVRPVHDYDPAVVEDFHIHLGHVVEQLAAAQAAGATVVLRGGGGMGAGAEYLSATGGELEPHALSTQAGFQFRYEFRAHEPSEPRPSPREQEHDEADDAYANVGELYRTATRRAYEQCGRDYANYGCVCPTTHAIVVCLMGRLLGDVGKIPTWLQQQHCPANALELAERNGTLSARCDELLGDHVAAVSAAELQSSGTGAPICADVQSSGVELSNAPGRARLTALFAQ